MEKVICPNCKTENDEKNLFCQSCGTKLTKPAPASSEKTVMSNRTQAPAAVPPPPPMPAQAAPAKPPVMPTAPPVAQAIPPAQPPAGQPLPPPPSYAPPPAYGYPPAPMYMGTPIKDLGVRADGWSDIIEDGAELADKVKKAFAEEMAKEKLPGVRVTDVQLSTGEMETRPYQLVNDSRGITLAVRVAPYGKNLFVGWDLYTRRSINWLTIGLIGGIVFLLAGLNVFTTSYYYSEILNGIFGVIGTFINWLLVPSLFFLLLGKIVKDDWLAFYVKDLNEFAADDAVALSTIVDNALSHAVEECTAPEPSKTKK